MCIRDRDVGVYDVKDVSEQKISSLMVGRNLEVNTQKDPVEPGRVVLDVRNLNKDNESGKQVLHNINFQIMAGEMCIRDRVY